MNARFVLDFLREESIAIAAQDLLGVSPRKVHFFPATGKAQVKRLHLQPGDVVEKQEREYPAKLAKSGGGEIEMFQAAPR